MRKYTERMFYLTEEQKSNLKKAGFSCKLVALTRKRKDKDYEPDPDFYIVLSRLFRCERPCFQTLRPERTVPGDVRDVRGDLLRTGDAVSSGQTGG